MNRNTKQLSILFIFIFALLAVTGTAIAQSPSQQGEMGQGMMRHGGKGGHRDGIKRLTANLESLDLNPEQRKKIDTIVAQIQPEMRVHRDAMKEGRRTIHQLPEEADDYIAKVRSLADEQGKHLAELIVLRAKLRTQVGAVLTPEQQTKLKAMRANRPRRGKQRGNPAAGQ